MDQNKPQFSRSKRPVPPGIRLDSAQLGAELERVLSRLACSASHAKSTYETEDVHVCSLCREIGERLAKPIARALIATAKSDRDFGADMFVAAGRGIEVLLREAGSKLVAKY